MKREREITAVVGQVSSTDLRSGLHGAREGDLRLEIAAQGLEEAPTTDHAVVFEGQDFQIVAVDPVYASDQVATYVVAARR